MCIKARELLALNGGPINLSQGTQILVSSLANASWLGIEQLVSVGHWKLRGQYARVAPRLLSNSVARLRSLTKGPVSSPPTGLTEVGFRIKELRKIEGVGMGMASAILALRFPHYACVVDFRGWRQMFCESRKSFTIRQYLKYLDAVRRLGDELGWTPLQVDIAIWRKDMDEPQAFRRARSCCN